MTTPDENDVRIRDDFEFILNCNNTRSWMSSVKMKNFRLAQSVA
jgi:hypothetical protein